MIFLIVILVLTLGFIIPLAIIEEFGTLFRVIGFVFCGFFFLFAAFLLVDLLFHYEVIEGDELSEVILFKKKTVKIKEITRIESEEGYYHIYVGKKRFCTLNAYEKETSEMLYQFERHGFNMASIVKVNEKARNRGNL